jgi:hypothetical protein
MFVTVDDYCCVFVGRPLWREVGSVDGQSESAFLSRLSVCIYVFTFQMFNIQICVRTLYLRPLSVRAKSKSKLHYDRQSASPSWCQAPIWDLRPIFPLLSLIMFRQLRGFWCGAPSVTRRRVCNLQCIDASSVSSSIATDSLSASSSWFLAPNGAHNQILISLFDNYFLSSRYRAPSPISPLNRVMKAKIKSQSYVSVGRNCLF